MMDGSEKSMNKRNFQKELDKILNNISIKQAGDTAESTPQHLLLHSCCAPCSTAVIERLAEFFKVDVYYYNPNIEPEEEYLKRLEEQRRLIGQTDFAENIGLICGEYNNEEFLEISTLCSSGNCRCIVRRDEA